MVSGEDNPGVKLDLPRPSMPFPSIFPTDIEQAVGLMHDRSRPPGLAEGVGSMKILALILIVTSLCLSQTIYFQDDFNDGNADGWYEFLSDANYEVNDSLRYEISYTGAADTFGLAVRGDNGTVMSVPDYSVRVEVIASFPTQAAGVDLRFSMADSTGYACYLNWQNNTCSIGRYDDFFTWIALETQSVPGGLIYGTPYWMRFECEIHDLRVKVWEGGTGDEPDDWFMDYTDYQFNDNGCMGLDVCGGPPYMDFDVEFDNVTVSEPYGAIYLEQSTWGSIKATFP